MMAEWIFLCRNMIVEEKMCCQSGMLGYVTLDRTLKNLMGQDDACRCRTLHVLMFFV
jgi:hypothetical protein